MNTLARLNVSSEAIASLCRDFGVAELSAFGSVVRSDFSAGSDVDLLVSFEPGHAVGLFHILRLQHRLSELVGRRVDLVLKSGLKASIRDDVLASAQLLYAA